MKAETPALPRRDDVLVDDGAAAPKSCLSTLEMHTPTAAGGLLPADKTSRNTRVTCNQSRLRFCPTEDTSSERKSIQHASFYSIFWSMNNQLAAPSWRRVIQPKSRQTLEFDPGSSTGCLRVCPYFWERGARCFVGSFSLGRWPRLQHFVING